MLNKSGCFVSAVTVLLASRAYGCTGSFSTRTLPAPLTLGTAFYEVDENPLTGMGGRLEEFAFSTGIRTEISQNWGLDSPRNPHISPGHDYVLFSAFSAMLNRRDMYIWPVGAAVPIDLSQTLAGVKYEDPNFSADGKTIVAKVWDASNNTTLQAFSVDYSTPAAPRLTALGTYPLSDKGQTQVEKSGPWLSLDGKYLAFFRGNKTTGESARLFDTETNVETALPLPGAAAKLKLSYYPELVDADSMYFVGHVGKSPRDRIFIQSNVLGTASQVAFNACGFDNSDPAPVSSDLVLFSSDAENGTYQVFLGSLASSAVYALPSAFNTDATGASATNVVGTTYTPYPIEPPPSGL